MADFDSIDPYANFAAKQFFANNNSDTNTGVRPAATASNTPYYLNDAITDKFGSLAAGGLRGLADTMPNSAPAPQPVAPSAGGGVREAVTSALAPAVDFASRAKDAVAAGMDPSVLPKGVTSTGNRYTTYDTLGRPSGQIYRSVDAAHGGIPAFGDNQFDLALNSGAKMTPQEEAGYAQSAGIRGQQIAAAKTARAVQDYALQLHRAQMPQNSTEYTEALYKDRAGQATLQNAGSQRIKAEADARLTGNQATLLEPEERAKAAWLEANPGDFHGAELAALKYRADSGLPSDQAGNVAEQTAREAAAGATNTGWNRLFGENIANLADVNFDPSKPNAARVVTAPFYKRWFPGAAPSGMSLEYSDAKGNPLNTGLSAEDLMKIAPAINSVGVRANIQKNLRPVTSQGEDRAPRR